MIPAHSLDSIVQAADKTLGVSVREVRIPVVSNRIELMIPGRPPSQSAETRLVETRTEQWSKLVGVLFCSPTSKLGKDEVLPHLDYFHHRSALFIDFFCVGYGAYWPTSKGEEKPQVVATVGEVKWQFSAREFNNCRSQLEAISKWRYSGESDLLLVAARKIDGKTATLDFSTAVACNLEEMGRDGAITSARSFFEKIFQFGEQCKGDDPVWELSDKMGLGVGMNLLQEAVLSLLPESTRKAYKSAKHYAICDISR